MKVACASILDKTRYETGPGAGRGIFACLVVTGKVWFTVIEYTVARFTVAAKEDVSRDIAGESMVRKVSRQDKHERFVRAMQR